jgi:hypothetical protein
MKVLFLGISPIDLSPIDVRAELGAIRRMLKKSQAGRSVEVKGVRASGDLVQTMQDFKPDVVHISSHGNPGGLYFQDRACQSYVVPAKAVTELFRILGQDVKCVFLNACYSRGQAAIIRRYVQTTIGMAAPIFDHSAIALAATFYGAAGDGRSVRDAFDLARLSVEFRQFPGANVPRLLTRKGVDASKVNLVSRRNRQTNARRRKTRKWRLLANFVLIKRRPLVDDDHYEIRLFLDGAPATTSRVTYRLHDSYRKQVRIVRQGEPQFQEFITSYGDFEVKVTAADANGRTMTTHRWLSSALEENYGATRSRAIQSAIDEIIRN